MRKSQKQSKANDPSSWKGLNNFLTKATEEEAKALLDEERVGRRRRSFLTRIYSRYNRKRAARERRELFARTPDPKK